MSAPAGGAFAELGPVIPPRGEIYRRARRVQNLAQEAAEKSVAGPGCDVLRALACLGEASILLRMDDAA